MDESKALARDKIAGKRFASKNEYVGPPEYEQAMKRALDALFGYLSTQLPTALLLDGVYDLLTEDNRAAVPETHADYGDKGTV